jgi:serine/threonine protein kinase
LLFAAQPIMHTEFQAMNAPHDPDETVDAPSAPVDSLSAGPPAGLGRRLDGPASVLSALGPALGSLRPVLLKEAQDESALIVKSASDAMPSKEETGDRYQLSGEIARGGMGAVLRARDVELGRDLAVKVLLEKYVDRPEVAWRFIDEVQIGGQLQHPGVVPVYDIGHYGDRPFFTMKLVKGLTLSGILAERPDLAADRSRLLGIALQVAQAMAYAHANGVIHRDLKPANIMVGVFGEVQVMDWGLAKVLAESGVADLERASWAHQEPENVTMIRTARSTGSAGSFGTDTEAGSMLGTPAYMPPEQANGDIANLDRRADVFGLGAILCKVLTGKPPYVGRSSEEVRRKAANGDLADAAARLDACQADQEVISAEPDYRDGTATDHDYANAFREAGIGVLSLSPAEVGARIKARPPSVAQELAGSLDHWAENRRRRHENTEEAVRHSTAEAMRLSEATRIADPWRSELRTTLNQSDQVVRLAGLQALGATPTRQSPYSARTRPCAARQSGSTPTTSNSNIDSCATWSGRASSTRPTPNTARCNGSTPNGAGSSFHSKISSKYYTGCSASSPTMRRRPSCGRGP